MSRLAPLALALALAGLSLIGTPACTGSSNGKAKPAESACAGAREHVESLYRAELPTPDSDATADRERAIADNTEMMLTDCESEPKRFAPCLQAAVSAKQMERDCLIPLDDEGAAEGQMFGQKRSIP